VWNTGSDDVETESRPQSRPNILFIEARSKYEAWEKEDSISKEEARREYVKLAEDLVGEPVKKLINEEATK
jgi:acyl-CoA-binding protein